MNPKTSSQQVTIQGGCSFNGTIRVPGDKSISHRALMIAALGRRPCEVRGLSDGQDVARTLSAIAALGARTESLGDNAVRITGGLIGASEPLYLGNSGTAIRLLAGLLAGFGFSTTLDGDASVRSRPMDRIIVPLSQMGASIKGSGPKGSLAPLHVRGGQLRGIDYALPVASAQVKSALLLAALNAVGPTVVREPQLSRTHTEEMLASAGAKLVREANTIQIWPGELEPPDVEVAGDPSQAAFWLVGALLAPDSNLVAQSVYLGPARCGFIDVLQRMGAAIDTDAATGTVSARSSQLTGTSIATQEMPGCIDEVPILAVAAAAASGTTTIEGIAELRVKETDRAATISTLLGALGVKHHLSKQRLVISGLGRAQFSKHATIDAQGDHRIAMAAAIAGAVGLGTVTITGFEATQTSYPGFAQDLATVTQGVAL